MNTDLKPGDMLIPNPSPGEISYPGIVVVNAVYDHMPLSETTDKFNTLRNHVELHRRTGAGEGIKVGVGDTGVDKIHMDGDLAGCIAKDFTNSQYGFYDRQSHGSHTTGHIGARGDGTGFLGLAPKASMYHAKVLGDNGSGSTPGIAKGIDWMVEQGCNIINLSLGGSYSRDIDNACKRAEEAGVLVFASMGNSGNRGGGHPGTSDHSFGITAVDYGKRVAPFSSRDAKATYTGYGVNVLSLINNGKLGRMSGTSMSCPDQCGVAANILSYMKKLNLTMPNMQQYADIVRPYIEDLGSVGHDIHYGLGFIDIWKVILNLSSTLPPENKHGKLGTGLLSTSDGTMMFCDSGQPVEMKIGNKIYTGNATLLRV